MTLLHRCSHKIIVGVVSSIVCNHCMCATSMHSGFCFILSWLLKKLFDLLHPLVLQLLFHPLVALQAVIDLLYPLWLQLCPLMALQAVLCPLWLLFHPLLLLQAVSFSNPLLIVKSIGNNEFPSSKGRKPLVLTSSESVRRLFTLEPQEENTTQ